MQPSFETRRNKFAWYGSRQLFHPVSLIFQETEHGVFIAHCYQYSPTLSTFLIEVAPQTWRRAGLDRMREDESRRYSADVFRSELGERMRKKADEIPALRTITSTVVSATSVSIAP